MLPESILAELRSGENRHCEFKRRAEKSLADEAAAFANASGGSCEGADAGDVRKGERCTKSGHSIDAAESRVY